MRMGMGLNMIIRTFEQRDNAVMLEIEKKCPQGDDKWALGVEKHGDILARYDMYDNWNVMVAEEDGEVAGWAGWTTKEEPLQKIKFVYLTEVMVRPESRRAGVATELIKAAERDAKGGGSDHIYCFIYEPNHASKSLFHGLGYSETAGLHQCAISAYKQARLTGALSIENPDKNDYPEVTNLINDYCREHKHFIPFRAERFEEHLHRIPAYGPGDFWIARNGREIVACAGLWESSVLADLYYAKEPIGMKIMGGIFRLLSPLVKLPDLPSEGERFKFRMVIDYAFRPKSSDAMRELLAFLNNRLVEAAIDFMVIVIDPRDRMFETIKSLHPQIEIWSAYEKMLDGETSEPRPLYVDARDLIP